MFFSSLRNLMSKDPRTNPELELRLKENAVTMNKMMELVCYWFTLKAVKVI
jgi:hypothetical protein